MKKGTAVKLVHRLADLLSPSGHGGSEVTAAVGRKTRETRERLIHGQSAAVFQLLLVAGKLSKRFLQTLAAVTFLNFCVLTPTGHCMRVFFFTFETSITFFFFLHFLFPLNISAQR